MISIGPPATKYATHAEKYGLHVDYELPTYPLRLGISGRYLLFLQIDLLEQTCGIKRMIEIGHIHTSQWKESFI